MRRTVQIALCDVFILIQGIAMPSMHSSTRHLAVPIAVAALLLSAWSVAPAQSLATSALDSRIRVDLPSTERSRFGRPRVQSIVGTLASFSADTMLLVVSPGAEPVRIPLVSIREAYASRGRPARWYSALRGAVVPALTGAALSLVTSSIRRDDDDPTPLRMAASSAAWGAASGAILGAWAPRERWHRFGTLR